MNEGTTTLRVEQVLLLENLETSIPEAIQKMEDEDGNFEDDVFEWILKVFERI